MPDAPLLFPQPRSMQLNGQFRPKPPRIDFQASDRVSSRLTNALFALGFSQGSSSSPCKLSLEESPGPHSGYTVSVTLTSLEVRSASEAGLFHGLTTLRQILDQSPYALPCLEIEDAPALQVRGYMLDISRCKVPTLTSLFELVDLLASLKYNQFQLYMENTFAYRDHEIVWQDASPLTSVEIRQLDSYCHDRYIEFVPNQNSFGHMERWLKHERYQCLAECPNGFLHPFSGWKSHGSTLRPDEASLDFVDALHEELLPNFQSRTFNVGCDEPWELGQGWSKTSVQERGKQRVYLDHLLNLHQRVSKRGRRMQFWGDIVLEQPELAKELPDDITALLWGYEADHPFPEQCGAFREAGVTFYVVPGTSTWNTVGGRLDNALRNIRSAAQNAIAFKAEGLLLTDWGDFGHHQPPSISLLPIIAAAGSSWNSAAIENTELFRVATSLIHEPLSAAQLDVIKTLGQCGDVFAEPLANATWLNKILFAHANALPAIMAKITRAELESARSKLHNLSQSSESLIDKELLVAGDMLRFACKKGLSYLAERVLPPLPQGMIESYRENWLARNRPGGLEESVSNLTQANT